MARAAELQYKIGFVEVGRWSESSHRKCEAPRHEGRDLPATVVIALSALEPDGSLNRDEAAIWGACSECHGLIDRDIEGDWRLPGTYSRED